MGGARSRRALDYALVLTAVCVVSSLTFIQTCQAITASYGTPTRDTWKMVSYFQISFRVTICVMRAGPIPPLKWWALCSTR